MSKYRCNILYPICSITKKSCSFGQAFEYVPGAVGSAERIAEEKELQYGEQDEKLHEDNGPQRPAYGHFPEAVDVETDDIAEVSVHGEGVVGVCNPLSNLVKKSEIQGNRRKKLPISKHRTAGAGIFAGNDYICDRMRQPRKKLRETPGNAVEKPMK